MSGQATVIILPAIGRDLGIPESRLQWILSAYSLSFGCFLLFWGRVADIYGKREIFIAGSAWFAATTLVNPFLPNEIAFDLFRGFQGLVSLAADLSLVSSCRLTNFLLQSVGCCCKHSDGHRNPRHNVSSQQGQKLCLQLLWYRHLFRCLSFFFSLFRSA